MTGFNPKDPEHQTGNYIQDPGRYVVNVESFHRHRTKKDQQAIVCRCVVLIGPKTGAELSRMFMLEGGGTRWTADLFNAVGCDNITDIMNDVEMSMGLGRRPFAAQCDWGDEVPGKTRQDGSPMRYMEIKESFPIDTNEQMELQRINYIAGMQPGTTIVTEKRQRDDGPRDDVPHPADMADDGPQQGGDWGPPGDDYENDEPPF